MDSPKVNDYLCRMEIDHDPKERRPKASTASVITIAVILGGGLALGRADWDAIANSDESLLDAAIFTIGLFTVIGAITCGILRAWDRLTGRR